MINIQSAEVHNTVTLVPLNLNYQVLGEGIQTCTAGFEEVLPVMEGI